MATTFQPLNGGNQDRRKHSDKLLYYINLANNHSLMSCHLHKASSSPHWSLSHTHTAFFDMTYSSPNLITVPSGALQF